MTISDNYIEHLVRANDKIERIEVEHSKYNSNQLD